MSRTAERRSRFSSWPARGEGKREGSGSARESTKSVTPKPARRTVRRVPGGHSRSKRSSIRWRKVMSSQAGSSKRACRVSVLKYASRSLILPVRAQRG